MGNRRPWELWVLFLFGIAVILTTGASGLIYLTHWPTPWEWLFGGYTEVKQSNYLLSATAQVLGALFALVFSITLIAVQFVTKYTHRTMKIIFDWKLFFYMGGFACSVVLPLWWLLYPTEVGTYISLVVGSSTVASLLLLFLDLRKRMNIGWAIDYIKAEALKAVENGKIEEAKENINALDNIGMGAYTDRNFEAFGVAERALIELLIKVGEVFRKAIRKKESPGKEWYVELRDFLRIKISHACKETIDSPNAPIIIMKNLGELGIEVVRENLLDLEPTVKSIILEVVRHCNDYPRPDLSIVCFEALHRMMLTHETNKRLIYLRRKVNTYQEMYIADLLYIYDMHLRNKWGYYLVWLARKAAEYLDKFELQEWIREALLVNVWIAAARYETIESFEKSLEDLLIELWVYLRKKALLDEFLKEVVFEKAVKKGSEYGIDPDVFEARWDFMFNYQKERREYQMKRKNRPD